MKLTRRNFFKTLGVTAAAVAIPGVALAALSEDRYDKVIRIFNEVLSEYDRGLSPMGIRKADELFDYTMKEFGKEMPENSMVNDMFHKKGAYAEGYALTKPFLRTQVDPVVPLVVARLLLSTHKIRIAPNKMPSWKRFAKRYNKVVLDN